MNGRAVRVSIFSPRREHQVGDAQCFDDWCIAVVDAHRLAHEGGFPIGWLIISEGGWFQRPAIVRLH